MGLPTSLEAEYGHIRYMVNVVLDRPMWPDQEYECMFTVIKPVNLNLDRSLRVREDHTLGRNNIIYLAIRTNNKWLIFAYSYPASEKNIKRFIHFVVYFVAAHRNQCIL